jgi:hypothetical protein
MITVSISSSWVSEIFRYVPTPLEPGPRCNYSICLYFLRRNRIFIKSLYYMFFILSNISDRIIKSIISPFIVFNFCIKSFIFIFDKSGRASLEHPSFKVSTESRVESISSQVHTKESRSSVESVSKYIFFISTGKFNIYFCPFQVFAISEVNKEPTGKILSEIDSLS